jgi:hypothetical protein
MVNADVMGTAVGGFTLPRAIGIRRSPGLLAEQDACCYRLDFKQVVYLFGLQWSSPEMET